MVKQSHPNPPMRFGEHEGFRLGQFTSEDLKLLQAGSGSDLFHFAIAAASASLTAFTALFTGEFGAGAYLVFVSLAWVGAFVSALLFLVGWKSRRRWTDHLSVMERRLPSDDFKDEVSTVLLGGNMMEREARRQSIERDLAQMRLERRMRQEGESPDDER